MLRHVDLCSGIGGFALGFEWAGLSKPVMFCDIEPWSRKILAKHWPDVPIEEDVKVLANEPERIPECSILTAGYPCQPFSHAGKRRGEEDDRHIWPYIREIVAQKRPTWCVFENVYGHLSMGIDTVLSNLEADGYATRPFIVPACGVDAAHRRDRIWIIAHANSKGEPDRAKYEQRLAQDVANSDNARSGASRREANEQRQADEQGWQEQSQSGISGSSADVADSTSERWSRPKRTQSEGTREGFTTSCKGKGWQWKPEPSVGRVAYGIPNRVDRLKGLGNAIVPQIAMQIGLTIKAVNDVV